MTVYKYTENIHQVIRHCIGSQGIDEDQDDRVFSSQRDEKLRWESVGERDRRCLRLLYILRLLRHHQNRNYFRGWHHHDHECNDDEPGEGWDNPPPLVHFPHLGIPPRLVSLLAWSRLSPWFLYFNILHSFLFFIFLNILFLDISR